MPVLVFLQVSVRKIISTVWSFHLLTRHAFIITLQDKHHIDLNYQAHWHQPDSLYMTEFTDFPVQMLTLETYNRQQTYKEVITDRALNNICILLIVFFWQQGKQWLGWYMVHQTLMYFCSWVIYCESWHIPLKYISSSNRY